MKELLINWYRRYFNDQELLALFLLLALVIIIFITLGDILMPVFASIVIAYLLQWGVVRLEQWRCPHLLAVIIVYVVFLALLVAALLGLLPLLWRQTTNLINELPNMLGHGQALLMRLPERYPSYISSQQIDQLLADFRMNLTRMGQLLLSASLASIPSVLAMVIYFVLVPLLVYFFLMDRVRIMHWMARYLPKRRRLIGQVWDEVHTQIGNYVGGKLLEMVIVGLVSYLVFLLMGLQYAILLGALVGLSVIVPYVGAVVVTVPVLVIAFLQWGWGSSFAYLVIAYGIIITLDANVLVPLLFSEAVNLHPVAIIIATLLFGRLWGFWGVFFAIPLAALVHAVLKVLPGSRSHSP